MNSLGGQATNYAAVISHEGKTLSVEFSWEVISELERLMGKQYSAKVVAAFEHRSLEDLTMIMAVGSRYAMKADEIRKWSPPVVPTIRALQMEWTRAWVGSKQVEAILAYERAQAEKDEGENPSQPLPKKRGVWFMTPFSWLWKRVSDWMTSGSSSHGKPS